MTVAGSEPIDATRPARTPSVIVLGADALLAALPATPVQLAHACLEAGYQQVVPASWGDELVAQATLRQLGGPRPGPAIQCSCPLVASRLLASGTDLRPFLVSVVSPPVAVARYLRAVYTGTGVRITYAGRCPGAVHDDIDARVAPQELLAELGARGIVLSEQPRVFDSIVPPDRRRFFSQPGGLPSTDQLWSDGGERALVELGGGDVASEIAELLLSGRNVLVDPSARLGCFCSGALEGATAGEARARLVALEPPRAASAVVRPTPGLELDRPLPEVRHEPSEVALPLPRTRESATPTPPVATGEPERRPAAAAPRRRSPAHGIPRPVLGASPITRDQDGRQLPRTYVARRRSTPRPFRVHIDVSGESVTITESEPTTAAVATPPEGTEAQPCPEDTAIHEREVQLLVTSLDASGEAIVADQPERAGAPVAETTREAGSSPLAPSAHSFADVGRETVLAGDSVANGVPADATGTMPTPARGGSSEAERSEQPEPEVGLVDAAGREERSPEVESTVGPALPPHEPVAAPSEAPTPRVRPQPAPGERSYGERPFADRPHGDRPRASGEVRRPRIERVVLPLTPAPVGTLRPSPRQLGIALVLVALVIAASVAFGVVLGRWAAQPGNSALGRRPAAGSAPGTSAPAPKRTPRPADSSLIDAL